MAQKKDEKSKNLDDILDALNTDHSKDLDASFKAYDKFTKDEHQNHLFNNVFSPAQDELYNTLKTELDKVFKDDSNKTHKKKKEVKKAVTKALHRYFDKAHPSLTKLMTDLEMDEDQQYDYLTEQYNTQVGVGTRVGDALKIKDIRSIEGLSTDKNATVGHLKAHLYRENAKYVEGSVQIVNSKFVSHHLGKYHPTKIAAYLRPKLEKEGHEVEDKIGFATGSLGDMLELRKSLVNKEGHKYLKKKETAEANK